jgi:hypothetical protein
MVGSCEHGSESSGVIEGGEFVEYTSDYQLVKDYSVEFVNTLGHLEAVGPFRVPVRLSRRHLDE